MHLARPTCKESCYKDFTRVFGIAIIGPYRLNEVGIKMLWKLLIINAS